MSTNNSINNSAAFLNLPATTSTDGQISIGGFPSFWAPNGTTNIFAGASSGNATTTGMQNSGYGSGALLAVTDGIRNTALGHQAATALQGGDNNVSIGYLNMANAVGDSNNTAVGAFSLNSANGGSNNVAVGYNSGSSVTTGTFNVSIGANSGGTHTTSDSYNIDINHNGVSGESNTLRIGSGTGTGSQQLNAAFISGIQGITITGTAVLVSSSDQLGIAVSSARFKEDIQDMNDVSSSILNLRPVTFKYNTGEDRSMQTGLIAEEVYKSIPSLVTFDKEGQVQSVKYHDLPALILNELQKAIKRIDELEYQLSLKRE